LRNQGRGKQVLIHQDKNVRAIEQNKDVIIWQDEVTREIIKPQNEDAQNWNAKAVEHNVDEAQQDAISTWQGEEIQQDGKDM